MKFNVKDVALAKKGNKDAFARLYDGIYADLYKMAVYILGNREDAEDVVSDTVIDAYREIKDIKNDCKFDSWILKILTNKCKTKFKLKYRESISSSSDSEELVYEHSDADTYSDVQTAFSKLSEEERMLVSLSVFSGYKSHELGKVFGLKPTTVRSKLSRAMDKMKVFLEGDNDK